MWSWRRAPETRRAAAFCTNWSRWRETPQRSLPADPLYNCDKSSYKKISRRQKARPESSSRYYDALSWQRLIDTDNIAGALSPMLPVCDSPRSTSLWYAQFAVSSPVVAVTLSIDGINGVGCWMGVMQHKNGIMDTKLRDNYRIGIQRGGGTGVHQFSSLTWLWPLTLWTKRRGQNASHTYGSKFDSSNWLCGRTRWQAESTSLLALH